MDNALDNAYTFSINGRRVEHEEWMHSREDGCYQSFYANGQLRCECNTINSKWHGTFKHFTEGGDLKRFNNWVDGVIHGVEREYNNDGSFNYENVYVNGMHRPDLRGKENRLARLVIFGYDVP